ncbi:nucleoside phosphorylase domain-containing protein [Aspergillus falconensis]
MARSTKFSHDDYIVAWIRALPLEMADAKVMLNVMLPTFARLRFGLMVGIGGGMPREDTDIRLGDVVGSLPGEISGGVNQYNFGMTLHNERFQRIGSSLNNPPQFLLMAISQIWIVSGNQVIKEAAKRDALAQEMDILCFEAEAAGLMDQFPCLVFRGICDYCDSHKNKECQGYAALAAAAYAKALLELIPKHDRQPELKLTKTERGHHWMVPFHKNLYWSVEKRKLP